MNYTKHNFIKGLKKKYTLFMAAFIALISMFSSVFVAFSQSSLNVKKENKFAFDSKTEVDITVNMQGQETKTNSMSQANLELTCLGIDKNEYRWGSQELNNRIKIVGQTGFPKNMDTTIQGTQNEFYTNAKGIITKGMKKYQVTESDNINLFNFSMRQNILLFSPLMNSPHKVGESWIDTKTDTLLLAIMRTGIVTNTSIKKTYIKTFDTLNQKVAHISFQTIKSSVNSLAGEASSVDMAFDGTMNTNGDFYYSVSDGILVCSNSETNSDINLTMKTANNMVFPIKQISKTTYLRTQSPPAAQANTPATKDASSTKTKTKKSKSKK